MKTNREEISHVTKAARPAEGDWDALVDRVGDAQIVLIGEASHGTHEFYETRAEITRRLIAEKGFRVIALESDWPDTLRVHRYVNGRGDDEDPEQALGDFKRFPAWMWRNTVMVDFVSWLREWNAVADREKAGIFGMDLYSLHASIESVLDYLDEHDPEAARKARERYGCFEMYGENPQTYGFAASQRGADSCEDEVVEQLVEIRRKYAEIVAQDGQLAEEEYFFAEQNARVVRNAEQYYRAMYRGRDNTWNLRDEHMTDTIGSLVGHYDSGQTKVVVWAHNSHLGDARATEASERGEWNVGQLVRERHGKEAVFSIGFSTFTGSVTAARDWDAVAERRHVRAGLKGSYEDLFHQTGIPRFWIDLGERSEGVECLRERRLQRAIGVIYRPETERWSHYFETCLPDQFDAMIHLDETRALEPLERTSEWDDAELPDTFPAGL